MNRADLINELLQLKGKFSEGRDEFTAGMERIDRLIGSLRSTPSQPPPAAPPERDAEGFYAEPAESFREPPAPEGGVRCDCGLPAKRLSGTKNGREWAGWFCNRAKTDPQNCGFRQWE